MFGIMNHVIRTATRRPEEDRATFERDIKARHDPRAKREMEQEKLRSQISRPFFW